MAAIITPTPELRPLPAASPRPRLTLIEGGRSERNVALVYRRRRIVAAVVVLALALAALAGGRAALAMVTPHAPTSATAAAAPGAPTELVQPGDSLWSIARRIQPTGDVRSLVDRLSALHGPGPLQPGERIALPD